MGRSIRERSRFVLALQGSAVLAAAPMVAGAIGPWAQGGRFHGLFVPFGPSEPNPDDAWQIRVLGLIGLLPLAVTRDRRSVGLAPVAAGLWATAVLHPAAFSGYIASHPGWGLVLATIGSISLTVVGLAWIVLVPRLTNESLAVVAVLGVAIAVLFAFTLGGMAGEIAFAVALVALVWRLAEGAGRPHAHR